MDTYKLQLLFMLYREIYNMYLLCTVYHCIIVYVLYLKTVRKRKLCDDYSERSELICESMHDVKVYCD